MPSPQKLSALAKLIRYYILSATTAAGSGHPSSSLSATDLLAALFFGGFFKADLDHPEFADNDRLIFSKGHASPLLYALYAAAGRVSETELMTLRKFGSHLEGHPTMAFPYTEVATGSLGQGLSVGVGMALNARLDRRSYRTFVLIGDSEMTEGSVWEAIQLASHYRLNNLMGILDVNRLGQRGETMYGWDVAAYTKRIKAFGWNTIVVNGHNYGQITQAYAKALKAKDGPVMIIAKTIKGKGVSFIENKDGWHGKALSPDELAKALAELGSVDKKIIGEVKKPLKSAKAEEKNKNGESVVAAPLSYPADKPVATRRAYGNALARLAPQFPNLVALDAEVSNSTFAEIFKKTYPDRFFEMYIAEQNMVGVALGLARRGKIPFVSTFAAFLTRAFDQIRMSQYSNANIKFVGSHAGVSIGEDGASQMALEDIAMFRAVQNMAVLYPSDAIATERLVEAAARRDGNVYIRTTRKDTPIIYSPDETFPIGGSKTLRSSEQDRATIVAAGVTLFEALNAYEQLKKEGIAVRVIDLYSIKPIDSETLAKAAKETKAIITVEDHYAEGGIGEAVAGAVEELKSKNNGLTAPVVGLAVRKMPRSGKPAELLAYEEIDAGAIVRLVKEIVKIV